MKNQDAVSGLKRSLAQTSIHRKQEKKKPCRDIPIHGSQSSGYFGTTKKYANITHPLVFVKEVNYNSNAVRDQLRPDVYGAYSPAQAMPVFQHWYSCRTFLFSFLTPL